MINMVGLKLWRFTVIERAENSSGGQARWKCLCDCGTVKIISGTNLRSKRTQSCGCLQRERAADTQFKHGSKGTSEYNIWKGIKKRCYNKKHRSYSDYGGRGITVDERWKENFSAFIDDMGKRPSDNHSIERKDVNGDYEPSNCIWATPTEQARNKRLRPSNISGHIGVTPLSGGRWQVSIGVNGKSKYIGCYKVLDEAIEARRIAEIKYWKTAL